MTNEVGPAKWWRSRTPAERILVLFVTAYVLAFFLLAKRAFDVFGYDTGITAQFNSMMWSTLHTSHPFHSSCIVAVGQKEPMSNFAVHAAFFWVFLLPVYALWQGPCCLLFLQSLALGLSAIPAFRIARRALNDEAAAVALAAAFVFLPPVVSQNLNQVQEPSFLPFFFLFACYYFMEKRFGAFLVWALASCLNRENVPLAVAMFSGWALLERRSWRWILVPGLVGLAWFGLAVGVIMPWFRADEAWHVTAQFRNLGSGPADILHNLVTKPEVLTAALSRPGNVQYLVFLLQPLGWVLPLCHPAALLAAPDLAVNLLSDSSAFRMLAWHYNMMTSTAFFVSTVMVLRRMAAWQAGKWPGGRPALILGLAALVLAVAHWFLWLQPSFFQKLPEHDALTAAIETLPAEASLLAPARACGHLSSRPLLDNLDRLVDSPERAKTFEYVLVDANERRFTPPITREFLQSLYAGGGYDLIFAKSNVFIFHRKSKVADSPLSSP